jgi:hypothetical protein
MSRPDGRWRAYLHSARRGDIPLARLFFIDMLIWGTIVNLTMSATALILFASDAPAWLAVGVWVLPWPMNAFLCFCVWRTASRRRSGLSEFAGPLATLWAIGISLV